MTTEKNFDLKLAPIGIRKAAACNGIWSGKFVWFAPDINETYNPILGKVYNRNHPEGSVILVLEKELASDYTWKEIRELHK